MFFKMIRTVAISCLFALGASPPVEAQPEPEPLGIAMEHYEYPHPVRYLPLTIEGRDVRMGYMDVKPGDGGGDRAVVLMHGKNFFGAYWKDTIETLTDAGFRVIVPDQVGFGKSSKPNIHYSFHMLARNTAQLLDELGVEEVAVVGHSMGGMLAARFALMYPDRTAGLVLENPIGLEDYREEIPYVPTEKIYESLLEQTEEGIREYHRTYYVDWKEEYETYVQVHYRWTLSGEYPRLAWASALTAQMIYEQPVVHEFPLIETPTLLVIGREDRTVVGRGRVDQQTLQTLGQYPELGRQTRDAIPDAELVELEGVGHLPHLAAQEAFHEALLAFLRE